MYHQLKSCEICGKGTFKHADNQFLGSRITLWDGRTLDLCEECVKYLVDGREGLYEPREEFANPTVPAKERKTGNVFSPYVR